MLDGIEGFDWDSANVGHIMRHDVTPFEAEEATGGKRRHPGENHRTRGAMEDGR